MTDARLPPHLEIGALIRLVQAEGGFATVLHKGERDAGTILVVLTESGANPRAYERMPQRDGTRAWTACFTQDTENKHNFEDYIERRVRQDPDLWVIELDIAHGERFIGLSHEPH
jgi:hypothetical protein